MGVLGGKRYWEDEGGDFEYQGGCEKLWEGCGVE